MLWRLFNKLFGWEYIHMDNGTTQEMRKVKTTLNGEKYVIYFSHHYVWLNNPEGWVITYLTKEVK